MNILSLVTNRYASFYEKQTEALINHGVNITHIYPEGQSPNPAKHTEIRRGYTDYLRSYQRLLQEYNQDYDLVHVNYGLMAPLALAQPHRPIVLSLWGSDLSGKVGVLSRYCAKLCDEVIVMSEEMKDKLGQESHVIPHGIDFDQFKPIDQRQARNVVGWNLDDTFVLFPYHPSRTVKNYPLAKHIVEEVNKELKEEIELKVVYGVDHDEIPYYMNASDALLLTSDQEGFPNSIKEAMACNTPVVSTDVGDIKTRLNKTKNSHVCDSRNDLIKSLYTVLKNGGRSDGRNHISDLSINEANKKIIDLYNKSLKKY